MPPTPRPLADRFWSKVRKTDGCWLWTAMTDGFGYGKINAGGKGGRPLVAHRVSYEMHVGPIPPGLLVLHRCDTPACVRPDHLWVGTHAENTADMLAKGRDVRPGRPAVHWTQRDPVKASAMIRKAWVTRKANHANRSGLATLDHEPP